MNINIYNLIQGFEQDDDGAVRQIGADSWLGGRKATPKVHHSTNTKHKIQNTKYNTQTQTQYNTEMKKATDVVDISALFFPRWY